MTKINKDVEKVKSVIGVIFFTVLFLAAIFSIKRSNEYDEYKKTFKGEAIGFATRIKSSGETSSLRYYFYINKKFLSEVSSRDYNLVNKFYKVKYDLNNPEENYIVLEEELKPDSISLVKAGFTKVKYYTYDGGVTCKYVEGSKLKFRET